MAAALPRARSGESRCQVHGHPGDFGRALPHAKRLLTLADAPRLRARLLEADRSVADGIEDLRRLEDFVIEAQ
jgi:hypothetical protein